MKILITGGCGFLGSNLAEYGIKNGHDITVFDNLSRNGAFVNKEWLQEAGEFRFLYGDIRNKDDIENVVKQGEFDAVFHVAGQVAMTTSIENPYLDFQTNTLGMLNLLESIRKYSKHTSVFYSSTNKVYGDLENFTYEKENKRYICKEYPKGFDESLPLDFRSPYGCSKGAADQYMLDYYRIFGIKTVVFRHSSMYGKRQFATTNQGWIGWFCEKAIEQATHKNTNPFTISGNGFQVRDILNADDMVSLYYTALNNIDKVAGNIYNIGGTIEQSLSLLELFDFLNDHFHIEMKYVQLKPRESDQKVFVADIKKIKEHIGWVPQISTENGLLDMITWLTAMS